MSCTLLTSDLLLSAAAQCIPPMGAGSGGVHHGHYHQRQAAVASSGVLCIVGGSASQPGTTYLAALAALRAGADRVLVVCVDAAAAAAVRGYGPEVTLVRDASSATSEDQLTEWLSDCEAVLVGPGLDYTELASAIAAKAIATAISLNKALVIDGAALAVVADKPELVCGVQRTILTPNWQEFRALYEATIPAGAATAAVSALPRPTVPPDADVAKRLASRLVIALGGVCVLLKGREDAVAAGPDGQVESCALQGSGRRCSGQGALVAGLALVFANWCFAAADARANSAAAAPALATPPLLRHPALLAAYAAAPLARRCAAQAFAAHRRATLAGDMTDQIGPAFCRLFPEADGMR